MAHYEHLPLFKSSYDFMIELYKCISNFPKEYKYTIGEKLKLYSLELVTNIYEINSEKDYVLKKKKFLETINITEKCKILIRVSKDIQILSIKLYSKLSIQIVEILKQLEWWKKSLIKI